MSSEPTRLAKGFKACLLVCIPSITESGHWKEHGPTSAFNIWAEEVQFERKMRDYAKRNRLDYKHLYNILRPKLINFAKNKRQHWKPSTAPEGEAGRDGQGEPVGEGDEVEDVRDDEDVEDVEGVGDVEEENKDRYIQSTDHTEREKDERDIGISEHGSKIFEPSDHYPRSLNLRVNSPTTNARAVSASPRRRILSLVRSQGHLSTRAVISGVKLTKKRRRKICQSPPVSPDTSVVIRTSSDKTAEIEETKKAKLKAEKQDLAEFLEWL